MQKRAAVITNLVVLKTIGSGRVDIRCLSLRHVDALKFLVIECHPSILPIGRLRQPHSFRRPDVSNSDGNQKPACGTVKVLHLQLLAFLAIFIGVVVCSGHLKERSDSHFTQ